MKKLLHIIASPRGDESRTLKVSKTFLDTFRKTHPDWAVDELDLYKEKLPELTVKRVGGKYVLLGGKDLYGEFKDAWKEIIAHIERFLSCDAYLVSTPMWNFSIPYLLKQYIDIIVQPKFLFRYTDKGVEGLAKNKKMVVVTSRGGAYSDPDSKPFDHQKPYLQTVFGFVGITDINFIIAEPMDAQGMEVQMKKIEEAKRQAQETASAI